MNEKYCISGVEKNFLDWCKEYDTPPLQVRALMSLGIPIDEALQARAHRRIVLIYMNGQTKSLSAWCRQYEISPSVLKRKIAAGYTFEEAFESN